jgi:hypothetical protein
MHFSRLRQTVSLFLQFGFDTNFENEILCPVNSQGQSAFRRGLHSRKTGIHQNTLNDSQFALQNYRYHSLLVSIFVVIAATA